MKKIIILILTAINFSFVYAYGDKEAFTVNTVEGVPMSFIAYTTMTSSGYLVALGGWNDTPCIPTSTQGVVTIPSEVEYEGKTYTIKLIRGNAFKNCSLITGVNIPETITGINPYAFNGCSSLTSVTIPGSVTYLNPIFQNCTSLRNVTIGDGVQELSETFTGCTSLTSIDIPNSVISLHCFEDCTNLETITLSSNIKSIGGFKNCTKLTEIDLPESLESIGSSAFEGCSGLTSITIPNNVKKIYGRAFYNCSGLTSLTIPGNVIAIYDDAFNGSKLSKMVLEDGTQNIELGTNTELGKGLFVCSETPMLEDVYIGRNYTISDQTRRPLIGVSSLKNLEYGKTVTSTDDIDYSVFDNLETVKLSCSSIGNNAFKNMNLTSVTFGEGLINIGEEAFSGCNKITSVEFPSSARIIGKNAFKNCTKLKTVNIGDGVSKIDYGAFNGCTGLTNLDLGNVQYLYMYSFEGCTSLKEVVVPENTTEMKDGVFNGCTSLTTARILGNIDYLTAFSHCTSLVTVELPEGLKEIGNFSYCSALESITIPNSVTTINQGAFGYCTNLKTVKMPESLQTINKNAFWYSGITSITIPSGVTKIDESAFSDCSALKTVISELNKPLSINANVFKNIPSDAKLYVPYGKVSVYQSANVWKSFNTIVESAITEGNKLVLTIYNGNNSVDATFVVTNTNPLEIQMGSGSAVAFSTATSDVFIIPSTAEGYDDTEFTVTRIGNKALQNKTMTSLTIPNTIKSIGEDAFDGCNNLQSVNIGNRFPSEIEVSEDIFEDIPDDAVLYVPGGTKSRYEAIDALSSKFSQIIETSPISVGDSKVCHGSTVNLPIILNNQEEISGLQFKLTLPAGVSVVEKDGNLVVSLTDRTEDFTVMGRKDLYEDNSYLFVVFSMSGNSIIGNEGPILNVKLTANSNMKLGEYDIAIDDVELATSSFETLKPSGSVSGLIVNDVLLGDVNGDGKVSIFDAVQVVNYIIGNNPTDFIEEAADLDGNGKKTIFDAVSIVNIILSQSE